VSFLVSVVLVVVSELPSPDCLVARIKSASELTKRDNNSGSPSKDVAQS
jgi:hypothetical protein